MCCLSPEFYSNDLKYQIGTTDFIAYNVLQSLKLFSLSCFHSKRLIFIKRSLRPLDDCFLKPLVRTLETFKKVVTKITAKPFRTLLQVVRFFCLPVQTVSQPVKGIGKAVGQPLVFTRLMGNHQCPFSWRRSQIDSVIQIRWWVVEHFSLKPN